MKAAETSNFVRYQRIAPFYDVLDLPFEYGRYRGYWIAHFSAGAAGDDTMRNVTSAAAPRPGASALPAMPAAEHREHTARRPRR